MTTCPHCGAQNRDEAAYCSSCGAALERLCPNGHPVASDARFCDRCGAPLDASPMPPSEPLQPVPLAERRLVSVVFADLVGFTPLSVTRDPEDVRELLSRYFDACRRLVGLYGGVVEKFIGDAVMAVWGTPVAQEDDAERAVRTALDLVAAVSALADEVGAPGLRARAGVLTGEAAVNLGAVGEGMVAGDLVNTASRIQAAAEPGSVLVGEATRRASEQAIVFEEAGPHALKGKPEPVPLWRAVRVAAARGGAFRSEGLEAPFVGRERELRLVKELFHAAAEQSRAQLVQVTGIAGIGKSRLAWEFFKYLDGLADNIWWHRGRCLAYGEGVAYWALAEMVRTRAQIVEGEDQDTARAKLLASLEDHVPDPEERAWIGPRLANLLGLEERVDSDRQDLFAAWRLFFERLADEDPVVMVFEDLQWADQALLAFVEYLLEWSGSQRLFVLALSRPELAEQHAEFARGVRNAAVLALQPLTDPEMTALLDGYVPGLPESLKTQILERAQGVPLYAVETVRMLLDRGLLAQEGAVYQPTGEIPTLEIPESLHALAAARLDGLPVEERQLVQQACVLGKAFTKPALAAVTGCSEGELDVLLAALVRKEVLSLQADPRSPERGQYSFLQELLRQVAYDTLSRRDRKQRHLAAVDALEQSFPGAEQEVPEVIASHLLAASEAAPDDPDAGEIRLRAREALVQAGERTASLAAPDEGQRYLDQAAALAEEEPQLQAELLERAAKLAFRAGSMRDARDRLERAIRLHTANGDPLAAARAGATLADVDVGDGRLDDGARRLETVLPELESSGSTPELAATLASLGRIYFLRGELEPAGDAVERALALAERLALDETFVQALTSRALVLFPAGRYAEARILLEAALARARADELPAAAWRAANNLAVLLCNLDDYGAALVVYREVEAIARQRGDSEQLGLALASEITMFGELGRWEEGLAHLEAAGNVEASRFAHSEALSAVYILCERGTLGRARELINEEAWQRDAEQLEVRVAFAAVEARLLRAEGRPGDALAAAERGVALQFGMENFHARRCVFELVEAALETGAEARAEEVLSLLDVLEVGEWTPGLQANAARLRARLDARRGRHDQIEENFRTAESLFAERGVPFQQAVTQLEYSEWLLEQGRPDEAGPLLAEARETFERLQAVPWLERLAAAQASATVEVPA